MEGERNLLDRTSRRLAVLSRTKARHPVVVAYLALFVALGGSAVAAKPLIDGAAVRDESLTGADIKDDSLLGDDVLESSLGKVGDADTLDGKDSTDFLGATAKAADADKVDGKDASELSDGPAVVFGRVLETGKPCSAGPPGGFAGTGLEAAECHPDAAVAAQGLPVPSAKVVRNFHASIAEPLTKHLPVWLVQGGGRVIGSCSIPEGGTTCSVDNPVSINPGTPLATLVTGQEVGVAAPTVGFSYELRSP